MANFMDKQLLSTLYSRAGVVYPTPSVVEEASVGHTELQKECGCFDLSNQLSWSDLEHSRIFLQYC